MKNLLSVFLFVLILFSVGFSTGNAPTKEAVDAIWSKDVDSSYTMVGDTLPDIDTLTGNDSTQQVYPMGKRFRKGHQYIMGFGPLSGDDAASTVVQVRLSSYDRYGDLLTTLVVDTVVAAGGYIKLPINEVIFGDTYKVFIHSMASADEIVIPNLEFYRRRPFEFIVRNKF